MKFGSGLKLAFLTGRSLGLAPYEESWVSKQAMCQNFFTGCAWVNTDGPKLIFFPHMHKPGLLSVRRQFIITGKSLGCYQAEALIQITSHDSLTGTLTRRKKIKTINKTSKNYNKNTCAPGHLKPRSTCKTQARVGIETHQKSCRIRGHNIMSTFLTSNWT